MLSPNSKINCKLLLKTDDFIFLEKGPGIHSVAHNFEEKESVANWLLSVDPNLSSLPQKLESGLLHRLDFETSGVMVAARNLEAYEYLKSIWKEKKVIKEYKACVENPVKPGVYLAYIKNHPRSSKRVVVSDHKGPKSQLIMTEVISCHQMDCPSPSRGEGLRERVSDLTKTYELTLRLVTGFRHQLRAHLAFLGSPILGDTLYHGSKTERLFLHASRLAFPGVKGERLDVKSDF